MIWDFGSTFERVGKSAVGWGQVQLCQFLGQKPAYFLLFFAMWFGIRGDFTLHKEQANLLLRVVVLDGGQELCLPNVDAKLFKQFTLDATFGGFSGLDFAAGKLPLASQMRVRRPCCQKETSLAGYHRGANVNRFHLRIPMTNSARRFLLYPASLLPETAGRSSP